MADAEGLLQSSGEWMTAGDTILSGRLQGRQAVLPAEIGGHAMHAVGAYACADNAGLIRCEAEEGISAVGNYAFAYCGKLSAVRFPDSLKKAGHSLFLGCRSLNEVILPASVRQLGTNAGNMPAEIILSLSCDSYLFERMLSCCLRTADGLYVIRSYDWLPAGIEDWHAFGLSFPVWIPHGVQVLFSGKDAASVTDLRNMRHALRFDGQTGQISELQALRRVIREKPAAVSNAWDALDDRKLTDGEEHQPFETVLLTFSAADIREEGEKQRVFLRPVKKIWFWQAALPLLFKGRLYYIYRRYYLHPLSPPGVTNPTRTLRRRDIAVCTEEGNLVEDAEEAEAVYAKYRLLTIL